MLWLCLFLFAVETRAIEKGSNGYKVTEVKAVPAAITVQGYLEENGSPVNGTVQMKFKLYTTSSGGTPIWTSSTYSVNVSNGYFSKVLSISKKYFPGSDRYLEIVVNGQTLSPRLRITGVPYSFKADTCDYSKNADKLDGHNWGDKYPNADKLDDYDSGDFIRWKQSGGASVGQVLKWNGTQWSPADDEVGGASDTANYSLNSDKVDGYHASAFIRWDQSGGASTGQVLKWNGSQWAPSNDNAGGGEDLATTLSYGNSAGPYDIDMDDEDIKNVGNIYMSKGGDIKLYSESGNPSGVYFYGSDNEIQGGIYGDPNNYDQLWFRYQGEIIYYSTAYGDWRAYLDAPGNFYTKGDISCGGTKSFVQPHPNDPTKEIVYSCLEGPEAATYIRGTARLINGEARVILPAHFSLVTSEKGLTCQLTPRGDCKGLYIVKLTPRELVVRELQGGKSNIQFDYFIQGIRKGYEDYKVIRENRKLKFKHAIKE